MISGQILGLRGLVAKFAASEVASDGGRPNVWPQRVGDRVFGLKWPQMVAGRMVGLRGRVTEFSASEVDLGGSRSNVSPLRVSVQILGLRCSTRSYPGEF